MEVACHNAFLAYGDPMASAPTTADATKWPVAGTEPSPAPVGHPSHFLG